MCVTEDPVLQCNAIPVHLLLPDDTRDELGLEVSSVCILRLFQGTKTFGKHCRTHLGATYPDVWCVDVAYAVFFSGNQLHSGILIRHDILVAVFVHIFWRTGDGAPPSRTTHCDTLVLFIKLTVCHLLLQLLALTHTNRSFMSVIKQEPQAENSLSQASENAGLLLCKLGTTTKTESIHFNGLYQNPNNTRFPWWILLSSLLVMWLLMLTHVYKVHLFRQSVSSILTSTGKTKELLKDVR